MDYIISDELKDQFPFLSYARYLENEYLGIIQNTDNLFASMYVYNYLPNNEAKKVFLECGEIWWWESNRQLPINVFLKDKFKPFKAVLKTFIKKEFEIIWGPSVSLQDVMNKRIKKRQITLVKKLD
jgi:hypothetical protein